MTQTPSILVIDDDREMCETMRDVLRLKGYAVEVATAGGEGLERLGAQVFDAAIVDIRLPDISGLELLGAIKALSPETEVIFVTGYASQHTAIRAINEEAFAYLLKPVEMDTLLAILEKALEKQWLAKALRESEERYRLITETIRDAVLLLDMDSRLVLWNRRSEELTGYQTDELTGRSLFALLSPEGAEQAEACIEAARSGQEPPPFFEAQVIRKGGSAIWVEATLANILKEGEVVGRLGVFRDITDRRKAEEAQRETEALKAITELALAMAHEINNPLAALLAHLEVMEAGLVPEDQKIARLRTALDMGRRIADIVARLTRITRREVDKSISRYPMLDIRKSSDPDPGASGKDPPPGSTP